MSAEPDNTDVESLGLLDHLGGRARQERADSPLRSRADAEAVLNAVRLVDLGLDPARVGLIVRLLVEGLTGPAVALRRAALQASLSPGATELDLAKAFEHLTQQAEPLLGPMVDDLLRLVLRHSFETEAMGDAPGLDGRSSGPAISGGFTARFGCMPCGGPRRSDRLSGVEIGTGGELFPLGDLVGTGVGDVAIGHQRVGPEQQEPWRLG